MFHNKQLHAKDIPVPENQQTGVRGEGCHDGPKNK